MMKRPLLAASLLALLLPGLAEAAVTVKEKTVNGLAALQYQWTDSAGRPRTVSLKRQGAGNPGNGGYAIQMTFQYQSGGKWITKIVNADSGNDGGFGYFVSHERYRSFVDGSNNTIAGKIFKKDDSPLGRGFPVAGKALKTSSSRFGAYQFTLTYPRYGTTMPRPLVNGDDNKLPLAASNYKRYDLPITLTWIFEDGKNHPRLRTSVDLAKVGGPDRVSFDLRGPYGVMNFDGNGKAPVDRLMWADRFQFTTTGDGSVRLNSSWVWNTRNTGGRYHALIAGGFEMGLYEPVLYTSTALRHGYSDERGKTSAAHNNGKGCTDGGQLLPCGWAWPYQSLQYSLDPNNPNRPTSFKKMAWGSTAYYGTGNSLTSVYDTSNTAQPFVGYPAGARITYDTCIALGKTTPAGLTKTLAQTPASNCAAGKF